MIGAMLAIRHAMIPKYCPHCQTKPEKRSIFVRYGVYFRSSDKKSVRRFKCKVCEKTFSIAAFSPFYRSRMRHKRALGRGCLCSGVSQRRTAAEFLKVRRSTVVRMFIAEAAVAEFSLNRGNSQKKPSSVIQFDELETFEHSKCKPISISLAVEEGSRRILGVTVSKMAAKGRLAERSRKKYGPIFDERSIGRQKLFTKINHLVARDALIKTDENPYYPKDIQRFFPLANHQRHLGKRGAITGQGELKKIQFDPLFSLNHTAAMFRANVNRLIRRTWCTTKRIDRLYMHLVLYANYHNSRLLPQISPA
jgi:transposase-like protein